MKILTKTIILVFALILIAGATTIGISEIISKNIVEQEVYNHLLTTADSRADHIETFLETEKKAVEQLSVSVVIEQFLSAEKDDQDYTQKRNVVMRRLKDTVDVRKDTDCIFVLDKNGIIVASNNETDIGKDESNNSYFLCAKEGAFVKDAYVSSTGKDSIAFSAPVFDADHVFWGVVVARVPMEIINKITTDRTGLGETGEIYIINKDGYMITSSRFVNDTFLKLKVDTENARNYFGEHEHGPLIYKNYMGTEVLGAYAHIPDMGWCLRAEIDVEEAFAPVTWLTQTLLSSLALLSVLGLILSIWIAQRAIRPIVKLHHGTEEITKGNLDFKVGTKAEDEIGQLSRDFDSMTAELKKSRAELEEYSKGLEKKVEERTKELDERVKESEEQAIASLNLLEDVNGAKKELEESRLAALNMAQDLDKARQEAEKAKEEIAEINRELEARNTEMDNFTYVVSHDLKEPLRSVRTFSEFLVEDYGDRLDEEGKDYLERLQKAAIRMGNLIDDLLKLSRIGRIKMEFTEVDLNELLQNIREDLTAAIEDKNVDLQIGSLPVMRCQRTLMSELFKNLISNGIKFSEEENPVVEVGCKEGRDEYLFSVKDNGIGIEEMYIERIFDIFQRLNPREKYEGTGAGLTICKKIVEEHGGKLWVESKVGEGSTFFFTIQKHHHYEHAQ